MSDLSHVDISLKFNRNTDSEYEAGVPALSRRKPERAGKPRAARPGDLEARLYEINRAAVDAFHAGRG